jgi:G:T-mismatch repair DNA endonuclease (very short patch repair protein)
LSQGCPDCAKNQRKSTEEFIKNSKNIHGDKYDYSLVKYKNAHNKIKIICKKHGVFEQAPNKHINMKQGCPKCSRNVSKPEKEICSFLDELNVGYKQSDRSIIKPYELDIVIPSKKLAIEFNGRYWHSNEMIKKHRGYETADEYHQMKTDMCNKKGYKLLHINEQCWIDNKQKELDRIFRLI